MTTHNNYSEFRYPAEPPVAAIVEFERRGGSECWRRASNGWSRWPEATSSSALPWTDLLNRFERDGLTRFRVLSPPPHAMAPPSAGRWRVGTKVLRTVYVTTAGGPDALVGLMDTPELAAQVVAAVNASLSRG